MSMVSAQGITTNVCGGQMHTQRCKVCKAGKGDDPEVCGVYYVATIQLERVGVRHLGEWVQYHMED